MRESRLIALTPIPETVRGALLAVGVCCISFAVGFSQATAQPFQSAGEEGTDHWERAMRAFNRGEFEEAEGMLRALLEQRPDLSRAAFQLVRTLLLQQRLDDARSIVEAFPEGSHPGWSELAAAEVDYRSGDFNRAAVRYREAIRQDDSLAGAHYGLGRVLRAERRLLSAGESFRRAYELDPADPRIVLAWAGAQPSAAESASLLERFLTLDGYKRPGQQQFVQSSLKVHRALEGRKTYQLEKAPDSLTLEISPLADPVLKRRAFRNGLPAPVDGFILKVRFNGGKERKLLLDTGANGVILASKPARKDKIRPLAETLLTGLGDKGFRSGLIGLADTMEVGGLKFRNCTVRTLDKKHLRSGTDGIIGADVFSDFLIRLDFPERKIELSRNPDGACAESCYERDWVPRGEAAYFPRFRTVGGKILVEATANGVRGQMLIDSGAQQSSLSTRAAKTLGSDSSAPGRVRGISGATAQLRLLPEVTLELAGVRQINRYLYAFDLSPVSQILGVEIMGLAGNPMLKHLKVTLNYRSGWIKLEQ